MAYVLDANIFIQAKNLHYGLDFCPAFWDWLIAENAAGRVFETFYDSTCERQRKALNRWSSAKWALVQPPETAE